MVKYLTSERYERIAKGHAKYENKDGSEGGNEDGEGEKIVSRMLERAKYVSIADLNLCPWSVSRSLLLFLSLS